MQLGSKRDVTWRNYLVPESQEHGARFNMPMLLQLIDMYTAEGDTLLDPMAGIFSLAVAAIKGRSVYGIELEGRFFGIAEMNIAHLQAHWHLQTSTVIIKGDCRKILPFSTPVNCVITSPPYGTSVHPVDKYELKTAEIYGSTTHSGYGEHPDNLGDMDFHTQKYALGQVYHKCYDTLVPGGRLITVTKDSYKGGKFMEQKKETIRFCLEAGFRLEAQHIHPCSITGRQRKHEKDMPDYKPRDWEDILVFKKGE